MNESLRRAAHAALVIALLLASSVASALGLGQLEMRSKIGEPFLAEIPVISSDPAELEQLQARVPTAETFARIGLQGPDEVVSSLRFVSALDAQGRPVIRVTSDQPINEPLLTFLVEVEWGQGRLVREYSALVAAPRTVDAPLQPAIQAPVAAPSNAIVREPVLPTPAAPVVVTAPPQPRPQSTPPLPPQAPAPVVAEPAPNPAPAPVPLAPQRPVAEQTRPVRAGDTLSKVATELDLGVSLEQAMVALLRANPEAFINGDINQLKRGAVLRVPQPAELSGVDAQEAGELVQAQMARFQQARRPIVAPEPPASASVQTPPTQAVSAASVAPVASPAPARTDTATPRRNRARLEIVPPGASQARKAGTQSGLAAGGEGAMLRQEMDQTRETLAARDIELSEMRARVAELEKLQQQQQQLIALKDSQLATAQQRMAQAQQTPSAPAAQSDPWPWMIGGAVLLGLLALAAILARRQARARAFRAPSDTPPQRPRSIADAFGDDVLTSRSDQGDVRAEPNVAPASKAAGLAVVGAAAVVGSAAARSEARKREQKGRPVEAGAPRASVREPAPAVPTSDVVLPPETKRSRGSNAGKAAVVAPTWHAETRAEVAPSHAPVDLDADATSDPAVAESSHERLELARAYLDLGDHASARQLLVELVTHGDHASRQQASQLLRKLD